MKYLYKYGINSFGNVVRILTKSEPLLVSCDTRFREKLKFAETNDEGDTSERLPVNVRRSSLTPWSYANAVLSSTLTPLCTCFMFFLPVNHYLIIFESSVDPGMSKLLQRSLHPCKTLCANCSILNFPFVHLPHFLSHYDKSQCDGLKNCNFEFCPWTDIQMFVLTKSQGLWRRHMFNNKVDLKV